MDTAQRTGVRGGRSAEKRVTLTHTLRQSGLRLISDGDSGAKKSTRTTVSERQ